MILAHLKHNLKSAGFTMIELLIVIAIIAILATAVLAAINPADQINKATDVGTMATATELVKGIERFYVVQDRYPWNPVLNPDPDVAYHNSNPSNWGTAWVDVIVAAGEMKSGIIPRIDRIDRQNGFIDKKLNDPTISICFVPKSKKYKAEATSNCAVGAAGLPAGACGATDYLCVQ